MQKLKKIIEEKSHWIKLNDYIEIIEQKITTNPNLALDAAKSLLETISATILKDRGVEFNSSEDFHKKIKKTLESLEIISQGSRINRDAMAQIINGFTNITKQIGTLRNTHGYISHGMDLQREKLDKQIVKLVIDSSEIIGCFLINNHEDCSVNKRNYYDNYPNFNLWLDNFEEDYPNYGGIEAKPSIFMFKIDEIAYFEKYELFKNDNLIFIKELEKGWDTYELEDFISRLEYFDENQKEDIVNYICLNITDENKEIAKEFLEVSLDEKLKEKIMLVHQLND